MGETMSAIGSVAKRCGLVAALLAALTLPGGCAKYYIDNGLGDLRSENAVHVGAPLPVQLSFEFQNKDGPDGETTGELDGYVRDTVENSGLFSSVGTSPVPGGAILHVVIREVPLSDNGYTAFGKSIFNNFSHGLFSDTVKDGFVCTIDYTPAVNAAPVNREARTSIYIDPSISADPPDNATKLFGLNEAVILATRQLVANTLNEVAKDPSFPH
jgi:hypothetical protein